MPRKAPDLTVETPDGHKISLSDYKGKVVLLGFIHTTCMHCQHLTQTMSQLYAQHANEGFQPLWIAWNDDAKNLVPDFVKQFHVPYPVAYSDRADVLAYLGFSFMDQRLVVPQMVWVDRKGMIRAQTPSVGDESMMTDAYYNKMITTLLAEPGPPAPSMTRAPHHNVTSSK